jgi:hypothetical protein
VRLLLSVFFPLVLAPAALAGRDILGSPGDGTGGEVLIIGPSGDPWWTDYTTDMATRSRGGGETSRDEPPVPGMGTSEGHGSVDCCGQITIKLTWVEDYPNEPTPKSVILKEFASATWSGGLNGGSCGNGLGDPEVRDAQNTSGVSQGTNYTVLTDPGHTITRTCTPTSSGSVPSGNEVQSADTNVRFQVTATPVVVSMSGTVLQDARDNCLMGQYVQGKLDADGYELTGHLWSVGGITYDHLDVGPGMSFSRGMVSVLTWDNHPQGWRWKEPGDQEDTAVSCTAEVTLEGATHSVIGERRVQVHEPFYSFQEPPGNVSTYDASQTVVAAGPFPGLVPGIVFMGRVGTPPLFDHQGAGLWNFVQLTKPYRYKVFADNTDHLFERDTYWLDNSWPYGAAAGHPAEWPANRPPGEAGRLGKTDDTPMDEIVSTIHYSINDQFKMYQMYHAPDNGYDPWVTNSGWVPLNRLDWNWRALDTRQSPSNPYLKLNPGSVNVGAMTAIPEFPEYPGTVFNSDL